MEGIRAISRDEILPRKTFRTVVCSRCGGAFRSHDELTCTCRIGKIRSLYRFFSQSVGLVSGRVESSSVLIGNLFALIEIRHQRLRQSATTSFEMEAQ